MTATNFLTRDVGTLPTVLSNPDSTQTGNLALNATVTVLANSAAHERNKNLLIVASLVTYVAVAVIIVTGFVLVSIYAPAFVPTVLVGSALFLVGADKINDIWVSLKKEEEERFKEDDWIERKLVDWDGQSFNKIVQDIDPNDNNHLSEIGLTCSDLEDLKKLNIKDADDRQMKTLFARFIYLHVHSGGLLEISEDLENEESKTISIPATNAKFKEANNKLSAASTQEETSSARKDRIAAVADNQKAYVRRNGYLQNAAERKVQAARTLIYLLKPTCPHKASELYERLLPEEHIKPLTTQSRTDFTAQDFIKLANNKLIPYDFILDKNTTPRKLADILYTAAQKAQSRASYSA